MTKVVFCPGSSFSISARAYVRIAELLGKKCYFYSSEYLAGRYQELTLEQIEADDYILWAALDHPDINSIIPRPDANHDAWEDYNARYQTFFSCALPDFADDRSNPVLVQMVEELGGKASGCYQPLKVVEIPDDVKWYIACNDEMGNEWVAEQHRTWS